MKKLNNKGYLIVEIIVASALAMGVAYFLIRLTIQFSEKNEEVYKTLTWLNDKNILTNVIMEDIEKYNFIRITQKSDTEYILTFEEMEKTLTIDKVNNEISYNCNKESDEEEPDTCKDYTKTFDKALTIGNIVAKDNSDLIIWIPMTTKYSDEDFGIIIIKMD